MSETRQPSNGNDVDFARLRRAVEETNREWEARLVPDGQGGMTYDTNQPDPYAHLYNAQTRDLLAESQRQIEQSEMYRRIFDTQGAYVLDRGLPTPEAPAPYFAEAQHRLDILDDKFKTQRRLIYVQIVLLVLWVVLQAISILQRSGRLG